MNFVISVVSVLMKLLREYKYEYVLLSQRLNNSMYEYLVGENIY